MNNEWVNCVLSDIGEIVGGATPSTKKEDYYGGNIAWITPKDLSGYNHRYISHGERNITELGLKSCSAKLLPKNSVLFTSRAPIGYVAIAKNEVCTNQGFKSIIPKPNIDYLFLYYLLKYNRNKIEAMGSGTTFKEVSGKTMGQIPVFIPTDLKTQRLIASVLDSIDSKIETNNHINKEFFALTFIDKILKLKREEKSVGQESLYSRDFISLKDTDFSTFFYAKDKNNNNAYLYNKMTKSSKYYSFLDSFTDKNYLCFKPTSKYGDLNIAISFDNKIQTLNGIYYPKWNKDREIKKLVIKALNYRSSGRDKIKINNDNIIQEWIFSSDSPLVVMGMAEGKNIDFLKYLTNIILPVLLTYTIILLVLCSGFISIFIKKPIDIIKKAIGLLEVNNFGATIEAFSNDEFNNISDGFNEMSIAIKQKEQMKRYVSERLLQSVEVNGVQEAGRGKLDKVTILSSDIRNFTGISEKYEPSEIVEMLNSYFTKMQQAITANGGIIDKYIGDAIQAVFYDEPDKANQVIRASKAAIEMRKALIEFNNERQAKGLFTIENGIGIDTDVAITGTIGTSKGRKDFSVNGEVIKRAASLEAKTKNTQSKILLSKKSVEELDCHASNCFQQSAPSVGIAESSPINVGASLVCNDKFYSKIVNDTNTNYTPQQSYPCLITKDFDSESVELIDVR